MNLFMVIYSYYYYKIYKFYYRFITKTEADTFANLAYTCFIMYPFLTLLSDLTIDYNIVTRETGRIIVIVTATIMFIVNYLLFNYKDRFKKIEEFFDEKGNRTTSIIGYLSLLILTILIICWFFYGFIR